MIIVNGIKIVEPLSCSRNFDCNKTFDFALRMRGGSARRMSAAWGRNQGCQVGVFCTKFFLFGIFLLCLAEKNYCLAFFRIKHILWRFFPLDMMGRMEGENVGCNGVFGELSWPLVVP